MKKISLLFTFLFAITFTFAQVDVVVTIDINNSADPITDVMFKGIPSSWNNIQVVDVYLVSKPCFHCRCTVFSNW